MKKALVRYELRIIPRDTTRAEWKAISRWLRQCGQRVSEILRADFGKPMFDYLAYGVYTADMKPELDNEQLDKLRDDIVDYFRPTD